MKNLSISKKLLLSNLITIFCSILIALTALGGLLVSRYQFINFINKPYAISNQIKTCRMSVLYVSNYTHNIINVSDSSQISEYEDKVNYYKEQIQENLNLLFSSYSDENNTLKSYKQAVDAWLKLIDQVILNSKSDNRDQAITMLANDIPQALDKVTGFVIKLEENISGIVNNAKENNLYFSNLTIILTIIMLIISQTLIIVINLKTRANIIKPLKEIQHACLELANGNLNASINYKSKNEFGELADATRNSINHLSTYIHDIDYIMSHLSVGDFRVKIEQPFIGDFKNIELSITKFIENINDALKQINNASYQVTTNTNQVFQGSQLLADGSVEQTSAIQELSATISGISEQINQNAQNANDAKSISEKSGLEAQNGNEQMIKMIKAMEEINVTSQQISAIIKTIDDIAYQTNMLALNASIEAQRAGETGKGFAVVAGNVRNLANKSIEAVNSTTQLIHNAAKAVENGTKIANETAVSLNSIVDSTKQSIAFTGQIAEASTEQALAIKQVTQSVEQIALVVQANANTASESSTASEELFHQANLLKELISHFKINKDRS